MRPRSALIIISWVVAGCSIVLSEKDVDRIVSAGLEARRNSPGHIITATVSDTRIPDTLIRFVMQKGVGLSYSYEFENGMMYWTTEAGCVLLGPAATVAHVFEGVEEPSEAELEKALRWTTRRWLSNNEAIVHFFQKERGCKGYRAFSTPRRQMALVHRTETFVDKATKAMVLSREFDDDGNVLRERRATSVRPLQPDGYRVPAVPAGARRVVFSAFPGGKVLPEWVHEPEPTLDILARPRASFARDAVCFNLSRGGFYLMMFQRRFNGELLVSPEAKPAHVSGVEVKFWWIGSRIMFRWARGHVEYTVLTNVPPDVLHEFLSVFIGAETGQEKKGNTP